MQDNVKVSDYTLIVVLWIHVFYSNILKWKMSEFSGSEWC